jgi:hypothetical protein
MWGYHYIAITNPDHLTGKFNQHLQSCSVLLADECFYAGDRKHEEVLKTLITGDTIFIEPKGFACYSVKNYTHIILCTNSEHAVPASADERRYFVLRVSDKHANDVSYFKAIADDMKHGGRAALLKFLQELNLDEHMVGDERFELRRPPRTDALAEQQARSRRGVDALVEMACNTAQVPCAAGEHPGISVTGPEAFERYIETSRDRALAELGPIKVMNILRKQWGCVTGVRNGTGHNRWSGMRWPSLKDLRSRFEAKHGPQDWQSDATEWLSGRAPM